MLICLKTKKKIKVNGKLYIGRKSADYNINDDAKVSRRHAKIFKKGARYFISDNASSNGTKLNGEKIKQKENVPLVDGDIIKIGRSEFKWKSPPTPKERSQRQEDNQIDNLKKKAREYLPYSVGFIVILIIAFSLNKTPNKVTQKVTSNNSHKSEVQDDLPLNPKDSSEPSSSKKIKTNSSSLITLNLKDRSKNCSDNEIAARQLTKEEQGPVLKPIINRIAVGNCFYKKVFELLKKNQIQNCRQSIYKNSRLGCLTHIFTQSHQASPHIVGAGASTYITLGGTLIALKNKRLNKKNPNRSKREKSLLKVRLTTELLSVSLTGLWAIKTRMNLFSLWSKAGLAINLPKHKIKTILAQNDFNAIFERANQQELEELAKRYPGNGVIMLKVFQDDMKLAIKSYNTIIKSTNSMLQKAQKKFEPLEELNDQTQAEKVALQNFYELRRDFQKIENQGVSYVDNL